MFTPVLAKHSTSFCLLTTFQSVLTECSEGRGARDVGYPRDSSRCHPSGAARTIFRTCCLVSTGWTSTSAPSKKNERVGLRTNS